MEAVRHLIGSLVLGVLMLALWRLWPSAEIAAWRRGDSAAEVDRTGFGGVRRATPHPNALRVLFVGNSHTHYNNMPELIRELAAAAGEARPLEHVIEAPGGATLEQHLAAGRVQTYLRSGRWDYVVLQEQQQYPSFHPAQRERQYFAPVRTLDIIARVAGAKTILYMTWARRDGDAPNVVNDDYERMQERTREGVVTIAKEVGASVAPVGLAWRWVRRERPDLPLWVADGSHATLQGSYLAACVLYAVLYGHSPAGNGYVAGLPEADARVLQRAADISLRL
jgi:hypothetical protein